jgi:3-dehydroquinate synthase
MATGKTAVGRALAEILRVPFFDTDELVEQRAGKSIADIFAHDGEQRFRELEAEVCASLAGQFGPDSAVQGAVVATGGGALLHEPTFARLSACGSLVLLEATVDTILHRAAAGTSRPVLARGALDRARVEQLLEERRPAYQRVGWRVDTSRRSVAEVAFEIAEWMRHNETVLHLRAGARPLPGVVARLGEEGVTRIVVGRGISSSLGAWMREIGLMGTAFVFASRRVFGHHGESVRAALDGAGLRSHVVDLDDAEEAKSLEQVQHLLGELASLGATRDNCVVALGGGVTGDVAGFVAATYMRGLPFVLVPTTLLAQVDSSIGGKVGVNHPRAKNLLGAIHQPHLVLSDVDVLKTLPDRELASGMAEVIKTAIIGSPDLFDRLLAAAASGLSSLRDDAFLEQCVRECIRVKASIVEEDPYERGPRRVLNLGHTVGHAIEAALAFRGITHGEAVAVGLLAAVRISVSRGLAALALESATARLLDAFALPTRAPSLAREDLSRAMRLDKKRRDGDLAFVLPVAPGDVRIVTDVSEDEILAAFD